MTLGILDERSLSLWRILLGLYLLYDVYSRLSLGPYDLAWYTSDGFQDPEDTPHKGALHRIWFYRGSETFQIFLFSVHTILSFCFLTGFYCTGLLKTLLWVSLVAMQSRCMQVHDGSDSFTRHLVWWSIFLPLDRYWSVASEKDTRPPSNVASLALQWQIVLMYWGTVARRSIDAYSWSNMDDCEWLPPKLSAVHYALSATFATRSWWFPEMIRRSPILSQSMTMSAMILEFGAPLGCLLSKTKHWFGMILFSLHFGLFLSLRLPNWQFVGMLTQVLWIGPSVWNRCLQQSTATRDGIYKKTDGDSTPAQEPFKIRRNPISIGIQLFLFGYMWIDCFANRGWIPKFDNGDIGEGLRLSQNWIMYATVTHTSYSTMISGISEDGHRVDLLHYLSTGVFRDQDPLDLVIHDMSRRYPSARWERAVDQWAPLHRARAKRASSRLCTLINQDRARQELYTFESIEVRWKRLQILPVGSTHRYAEDEAYIQDVQSDIVVRTQCQ